MGITGILLAMALALPVSGEPLNDFYAQWENGPSTDSAYFPIAVWYQSTRRAVDYAACGINMYIGPGTATVDDLARLKAAGMTAIVKHSYFGTHLDDPNADVIVGWEQQDEPDNAQSDGNGGYLPCVTTDSIQALYDTWTVADATRPIYLNVGRGVSDINWNGRGTCKGAWQMYPDYIAATDIISYDIYPLTSGLDIGYVPKGIDSLRSWSNDAKPAWCWIECTHIGNETVMPTPLATACEVWLAIIHGARGVGYFCHEWKPSFKEAAWLDRYPGMKDTITLTNQKITDLAPALNTVSVDPTEVTVKESFMFGQVDHMVKRHGGYLYVFAALANQFGTDVTFTLNTAGGAVLAEVVGEGRSIDITDGAFTDNYPRYGAHVYKIADEPAGMDAVPSAVLRQGLGIRLDGSTAIFTLPAALADDVTAVAVYDAAGNRLTELVPAASMVWDGSGRTGVFLVRINAGTETAARAFFIH